jgi:Alcohol dehydrogenase GroES-like domain
MRRESVEVGKPGPGEGLVHNTAIGVNYVDTYYRTGLYTVPLPANLGREGAGVVQAVGPKVKGFKVSDRVAYVDPNGSYAEMLLRPADRLVKILHGISDRTATAMMWKGMTAQYLLRRTYRVKKGDTLLVHAAAGGVGQILCQWARYLGAMVIGTVGSVAKEPLAKKCGMPICHRHVAGQSPGTGEGDHQGSGRAGGVRRHRQGYIHGFARMPRTARNDGDLWQRLGSLAALQSSSTLAQGFAVPDTSEPATLHRETRRFGAQRPRAVRGSQEGCCQDRHQPELSPEGCGPGSPGSRVAQDDGLDDSLAVINI